MAEADVLPIEATGEERVPSRAGEKLRVARERLGLDRGEVSQRTKINERHLAAVEDSDFAALPARIYAVGFARSYAGAVGLDSAAIAAQVRRELNEQDSPGTARPAYDLDIDDPDKIPSRRLAWVAVGLAIALIAVGVVFWRSYFVPAVDLPPVRDVSAAPAATPPELSPAAMISPTAESAAGQAAPEATGAPGNVPAPTTAPAPRSSAAPRAMPPAASPAPRAKALPSPVPDRLQPLDAAKTQLEPGAAGAPAT